MGVFTKFSKDVTKALLNQISGIIATEAISQAEAAGKLLKERLLEKIRLHPICLEIENNTLPSNYIESESGTATLRGFLGFTPDEDPVGNLINFLDKTILVKPKRNFVIGSKIVTSLVLPTKDALNSEPSLRHPRIGIAWPLIIEDGIGGLANDQYFLQSPPAKSGGFSGLGIQVKHKVRGRMGKIVFLSKIFKEFREQFGGRQ